MALNPTMLKQQAHATIYAKMVELKEPKINPNMPPDGKVKLMEDWDTTAQAMAESMIDIITHIKTLGEVMTTVSTVVAVASVSGVVSGPAASGPGTGTGTGTGIGAPGTAII
jgi:hypothetical protein